MILEIDSSPQRHWRTAAELSQIVHQAVRGEPVELQAARELAVRHVQGERTSDIIRPWITCLKKIPPGTALQPRANVLPAGELARAYTPPYPVIFPCPPFVSTHVQETLDVIFSSLSHLSGERFCRWANEAFCRDAKPLM